MSARLSSVSILYKHTDTLLLETHLPSANQKSPWAFSELIQMGKGKGEGHHSGGTDVALIMSQIRVLLRHPVVLEMSAERTCQFHRLQRNPSMSLIFSVTFTR